ncbi:DNA helicase-2 / ATP-dependent DNA helicase PcrA [Paenibacillus sophorae]|uniref:DNA helicase-2 / ATP-dependent DNA helicase PcrA n=1 Tax=Paenibacillus sophorae TaxID=1333845 RepID=A0A1H8JXX9_9BACL|nr:RNA polymerase recycling motor HelD [Paenibacillus sophorae]QWU13524.1 UvrD-helicase domain-containing protein [Paenibacillus sophorae]SEN85550.1 DNA helicase-2 / ATP-dependent DNA helicase PcrA [Paenibacillus sophorae]
MSINETEWKEEQNRVDRVTGLLKRHIRALSEELGLHRSDVVELRKDFWEEVTVNFSSPDDLGETSTSLRQQAQVLSERERHHLQSSKALKKYKKLVLSPYFGRIDFAEAPEGETERIYLGIGSLMEDDGTFLIYDWRAPISSLYYDGAPGAASFETPAGTVSGEMSTKRQFVIVDGKIEVMFDTGVTIGDELLQQVLSHSADDRMKNIVATIQKEQNAIIRNDRSRMLVVQGAAGSGKTSAALQRVAYLLYKYRDTLQADQVLLFSPNPLFNSYVSTVLPELGEDNMQQTTFQIYLEHRLGQEFQLEDVFTQTETLLNSPEGPETDARRDGIAYKSSVAFLDVIRSYAFRLEHEGMLFKPLMFQGRAIVGKDEMERKFYSYDPSIRLANRIDLMTGWLLKKIAVFSSEERSAAWVEDQIELLDSGEYHRAYQMMRRKQRGKEETFDDFEMEKEMLARYVVSQRLKPLRGWVKRGRFVDAKGLYSRLFQDRELLESLNGGTALPESWNVISRQTMNALADGNLSYEDATPFLYLKELSQGFHTNTVIRHVFVDEVQDYSPFQLEFMRRMFPRAKMTVLGDLNQAIYAQGEALGELAGLVSIYGEENTEVVSLTQSYRSTYEIVEFTRSMIPGGDRIIPFNRRGEEPLLMEVSDREELISRVEEDILDLHSQGYHYVAVICKTAEESARIYGGLKDKLSIQLVTKDTPNFQKGTLVLPAYLAKGVEFDAVIICDGSEESYGRESERKLFYTACTRAMHILHIFYLGKPSRFIPVKSLETGTHVQ